MVLAGYPRWLEMDVFHVLNVAEALIVEEVRHLSLIGSDQLVLPHVDTSVPLATRYGYVAVPHDDHWTPDADQYDPESDPLFGGGG